MKIYQESRPLIEKLNNEQRGVLLMAALKFEAGETLPKMDPNTEMVFLSVKAIMEIDSKKDRQKEAKSELMRDLANKRWGSRDATAYASECVRNAAQCDRICDDEQPDEAITNSIPQSPIETIEEREVKERELKFSKEKQEKVDLPDTGVWADPKVREAFKAYAKMRVRIRKSMTAEAVKRKIPQLERLADTPEQAVDIINRATDNCWLDFYAEKERKGRPPDKKVFNFDQRGTDYDSMLSSIGL